MVLLIHTALYPGHVGGGKSGLVSTVCTNVNDSGNLLQTSPIMDKLHGVVTLRNNQTKYMACSVAAVFTQWWLPLSETQGVTRQGLHYNHRQFHHHCARSWNKWQSRSRWTSQIHFYQCSYVDTFDRIQLLWLLSMWNLPFQYSKEQTNMSALSNSSLLLAVRWISSRWTCFGPMWQRQFVNDDIRYPVK